VIHFICQSTERASASNKNRRAPVTGHQSQRDHRSYPLWELGVAQCLTSAPKGNEWTRAWHKIGETQTPASGRVPQSNLDTVKARLL